MSGYQSYTAYASLWNESLPSHWSVLPMYALAKEKSICGCVDLPLLSVYLDVGVIPFSAKAEKRTNVTSKDLSKYQRVDCGDFVLNNQQAWRGSVGISFDTGIVSPAYIVLSMNDMLNSRYANYLLRSRIMVDQYLINSKSVGSIQRNIYWPALKRASVPVPPRDEQDQIVRFLDWKVSGINKLIAVKQKQIATLKEFMQAEIKEQLYAYPVVSVVRLKQLGTFFKGGGFSRDNLVEDEDYPAILYGDIYTQYEYKTSIITHHIDGNAYSTSRKISKGDIVMAGTGETKDEIGKSILYMGEQIVAVGGDVIVFHPNEGTNVEYLLYQLYSQAALKHRYINGKGDIIVHIYPTALGNTIITLPGEADQNKAVARINEIIDQVNKAITVLTDEISVLREYRVRLVADTVTGKIDVRGIEIPEYEFVDEDIDNADENLEQGADEPPEEE